MRGGGGATPNQMNRAGIEVRLKEKKDGWGGSVVAVVPAGGEGDVFNTFMLVGDAVPTLCLCYHGLSVQEAKAIQVAH